MTLFLYRSTKVKMSIRLKEITSSSPGLRHQLNFNLVPSRSIPAINIHFPWDCVYAFRSLPSSHPLTPSSQRKKLLIKLTSFYIQVFFTSLVSCVSQCFSCVRTLVVSPVFYLLRVQGLSGGCEHGWVWTRVCDAEKGEEYNPLSKRIENQIILPYNTLK